MCISKKSVITSVVATVLSFSVIFPAVEASKVEIIKELVSDAENMETGEYFGSARGKAAGASFLLKSRFQYDELTTTISAKVVGKIQEDFSDTGADDVVKFDGSVFISPENGGINIASISLGGGDFPAPAPVPLGVWESVPDFKLTGAESVAGDILVQHFLDSLVEEGITTATKIERKTFDQYKFNFTDSESEVEVKGSARVYDNGRQFWRISASDEIDSFRMKLKYKPLESVDIVNPFIDPLLELLGE